MFCSQKALLKGRSTLGHRTVVQRNCALYGGILLFSLLLLSCTQSSTSAPTQLTKTVVVPSASHIPSPTVLVTPTAPIKPTPTNTPTPRSAPTRYTAHVLLQGVGRPDDLAFDQ